VLDACVLIPAALRDILLRAADAGMYQALWSEEILDEVQRNLISELGRSQQQAERLIEVLRQVFPEAVVTRYDELVQNMTNDPKDRHVVAATVKAQAEVIVTSNLRDFPEQALTPYGIEAQSPDEFLLRLAHIHGEHVVKLITEQANDLRHPPKSPTEVIQMIARQAPRFAIWATAAYEDSQRA
jgi:predicted nucleic acid-binding protein